MNRWIGLAILASAGCSAEPDPVGPPRGALAIRLTTPNRDDGGIMLRLGGATIDSVTPVQGKAFVRQDGTDLVVAIAGSLQSGSVAWVWVPEASRPADYRVTLLQAARASTYEQRGLQDYRVAIVP